MINGVQDVGRCMRLSTQKLFSPDFPVMLSPWLAILCSFLCLVCFYQGRTLRRTGRPRPSHVSASPSLPALLTTPTHERTEKWEPWTDGEEDKTQIPSFSLFHRRRRVMDWRSDDVRWGPEAAAEAEGPEENISCSPLSHTTQSAVVLPFLLPTDGCRRSWHFAPIAAASALCERPPLSSSAFLARPKGALILVADRPPSLPSQVASLPCVLQPIG